MRKVCVIGAGRMGSGIAAHLANVGFEVALLDRTPEEAKAGLDRARRAKPPLFYLPETADSVHTGTLDDSPDWVAGASWICEAAELGEESKKALYARLEPLLSPDCLVAACLSSLEVSRLASGRSESFGQRFAGVQFGFPPRLHRLAEVIPGPEMDPAFLDRLLEMLNGPVARRVVLAKDTPGFIACRFGLWCLYKAVHAAEKLQMTVEEVDAITGAFLGRPKRGSFRLCDEMGLDVMEAMAAGIRERCESEAQDPVLQTPKSLAALLAKGWVGDRAGQGYTRRDGKELLSFDLITHAYRTSLEPDLPRYKELSRLPLRERLKEGLASRGVVGEFLREHLVPVLRHAAALAPEVCHSPLDFDRAMQWGYGWEAGPFAMIDMIGGASLGLSSEPWHGEGVVRGFHGGVDPLPSEPEFRSFADYPLIEQKEAISVRDLGEGVTGIGLSARLGLITPATLAEIGSVLDEGVERLVLAGETRAFSVGFDLKVFLQAIEASEWRALEKILEDLQSLNMRLSRIPSVAAVHGWCLGGGYEMAASCTRVVAASEARIGLPEAKVGLLPGATGTVILSERSRDSVKARAEAVLLLGKGTVSDSADEARALGYLRREDVTVYQVDSLITEAVRLVQKAVPGPRPAWVHLQGPLTGMIDQMVEGARKSGDFSSHDAVIVRHLKESMAKAASFEDAVAKERRAFLELCREGLSQARIRHMLETGRPLRN